MKAIITGLVLFIATGAFAQKGEGSTVSIHQNTAQTGIKGVVSSFDGRSCNFYITAQVNGKEIKLLPMNLPSEFDVDGTKIIFDYINTSDKINATCGFESAVNVSNVKLQKTAISPKKASHN